MLGRRRTAGDRISDVAKRRWAVALGCLPLLLSGVYFGWSELREPVGPLDFQCMQPGQHVVEDVFDLQVDRSVGTGGGDSGVDTATWESEGRTVILVTCTRVRPSELADRTPTPDTRGFVAAPLPFAIATSDDPRFDSALLFTYHEAVVRIETIDAVTADEARKLVASWTEGVERADEATSGRIGGG